MRTLAEAVTPGTLALYAVLRLPALDYPVCHGYQNCCQCDVCVKRERRARSQPAQPWEPARAA